VSGVWTGEAEHKEIFAEELQGRRGGNMFGDGTRGAGRRTYHVASRRHGQWCLSKLRRSWRSLLIAQKVR